MKKATSGTLSSSPEKKPQHGVNPNKEYGVNLSRQHGGDPNKASSWQTAGCQSKQKHGISPNMVSILASKRCVNPNKQHGVNPNKNMVLMLKAWHQSNHTILQQNILCT